MSDVNRRLKEAFDRSGLSYGELSDKTGLAKSVLQRYLTGATEKIPLSRMEAIAKALGVSASYIMGWQDDPMSADYSNIGIAARTSRNGEQWQSMMDDLRERERRTLGVFVTPDEDELINSYRGLSKAMQEQIKSLIKSIKGEQK